MKWNKCKIKLNYISVDFKYYKYVINSHVIWDYKTVKKKWLALSKMYNACHVCYQRKNCKWQSAWECAFIKVIKCVSTQFYMHPKLETALISRDAAVFFLVFLWVTEICEHLHVKWRGSLNGLELWATNQRFVSITTIIPKLSLMGY